MTKHRPLIFARADKDAARAQWRERFNNRAPQARQPGKLTLRAAAADAVEMMLYDEIGFWGVTAKEFNKELAGISASTILLRINSPGGDVFDGLAIYEALRAHPATIEAKVEGLAASAASFIAMAANKVTMADSALMMIHKAWGLAIGNETDMLDMAATLEKIDGRLAAIYAKKTGKTESAILEMMAGESDGTWFTAQEAKDANFIDEIIGDGDGEAEADAAMLHRVSAMKRRLAILEREG